MQEPSSTDLATRLGVDHQKVIGAVKSLLSNEGVSLRHLSPEPAIRYLGSVRDSRVSEVTVSPTQEYRNRMYRSIESRRDDASLDSGHDDVISRHRQSTS